MSRFGTIKKIDDELFNIIFIEIFIFKDFIEAVN